MPIYEFACNACNARTSVFVRSISSPFSATCERCGGSDLRRLVSRFAVVRSGGDEFGSLDDDSLMSGFDESDPRAMAAWARRMQREMGEDMGPEFDEMVERLERGESLEDDDDAAFDDDDDFGDDDDF
jgi:putative FmdB family regulatory protein